MMPFGFNQPQWGLGLTVILIWSLLWKGLALWRAAKNNQKYWFVAMLIINSVGILEIIYLFAFAKNKLTGKEIQSWFNSRKS